MHVCIYLLTPPPQAGRDSRAIFKQSKANLDSEFFLLLDLLFNQG